MSDSPALSPGLYDQLISRKLERLIGELHGYRAEKEQVDPEEAPLYLARQLASLLTVVFKSASASNRTEQQLNLTNRIIELLQSELGHGIDADDRLGSHLLTAILPESVSPVGGVIEIPRPGIPLSQSALLVNARGEHRIGVEIEREIRSADRVDLLCSFIKWSGFRVLESAIREHLRANKQLRVITTVYMGATDRRVLDRLVKLGAKLKVSYDTRQTRLHAKAWLFHRKTGFSTAYIGSSNLSAAAQLDGLEWNVRLSAIDSPSVLQKFDATFETYWSDSDFIAYSSSDDDKSRFDKACRLETGAKSSAQISFFDIQPYPFQREILDRLEVERLVHKRTRNLVIAATGTGKTVMAALDYRRYSDSAEKSTLLFVAHRKEILQQSLQTFRGIMRDGGLGELYVDGRRPSEGKHVFASVQSLARIDLKTVDPNAFDFIVIDEFHHAAAPTYERLLSHFQPDVLLGLTATPERADGQSILHWFGDHVAAELRLWDAIERGLLVPFQYFGVHDAVDISNVRWTRGHYEVSDLESLYTASDFRVNLILQAISNRIANVRKMRALGFCVGVQHAHFMARRFKEAGIPALALDANTPAEIRDDAKRRLRTGEVNVLFTVDLFNEGVDIPAIDTVLFLRPTESATIFLQQLGRGLRHSEGKECLTVMDFIGNANRKFRFDLRYRAVTGATRRELERQVESGFPLLPSGCSMQLDRQSREIILENIRGSLGTSRNSLVTELKLLGPKTTLQSFLRETGLGLDEIYRRRSFSDLKEAAGFEVPPSGPNEDTLRRAMGRLIHLDDPDRLHFYGHLIQYQSQQLPASEQERRQLSMLLCTLFGRETPGNVLAMLHVLYDHPAICAELTELFEILICSISRVARASGLPETIPLKVHCRYSRDEVMAAFAQYRDGVLIQPREGVVRISGDEHDLLFVTIRKSNKEYSPTTMYEDYAISQDEFHWQSQSTTRPETEKGRRHWLHQQLGVTPLLFIRDTKRDERGETVPYLFLGSVEYLSHEGERPMNIVWRLQHTMPADVFRLARVA